MILMVGGLKAPRLGFVFIGLSGGQAALFLAVRGCTIPSVGVSLVLGLVVVLSVLVRLV